MRHRWPVVDASEWQRRGDSVCQIMLIGLVLALCLAPRASSTVSLMILVSILVAGFEGLAWYQNRSARKLGSSFRTDPSTDSARDAQLVVVGDRAEIQAVVAAEGHWPQPLILQESPRVLSASLRRPSEWVKIAIALGATFIASTYLTVESTVFVIIFLATKCCADWAHTRYRPTYLRIAPGWLERVRFDSWRKTGYVMAFVTLSEARIVCRFDERRLYLFPGWCHNDDVGSDPERQASDTMNVCIDLRELDEPHALVQAVFHAARSAKSAPRLPLDALVG